jgi:hypothetical protein
VSWTVNFVASLAVLGVVMATGLIPQAAGTAVCTAPIKVALAKTSLIFTEVRLRGLPACLPSVMLEGLAVA